MQKIKTLLIEALAKIDGTDAKLLELTAATQLAFGDFQTNVAMQHAKKLKKNPRELAQEIIQAIPENDILQSVEVAGAGFINLRVRPEVLGAEVVQLGQDTNLGIPQSGKGQRVVIDYSSPNVAKTMHIAHLRSTIIGDAIKRLHLASGYEVIADNHIGDWGTQFGKLLVAYKTFPKPEDISEDSIEYLEKLYQNFNNRAESEPELQEQARAELVSLQKKEEPNYSLWKQFIQTSLKEFDEVYQRLGIQFDTVHGESFYNDQLQSLVDELKHKELIRESEGAQVAFFENDQYPPCVIQKGDGAFLYATTDLATVRYRIQTYQPKRIIYVTDSRQKLHFEQFFSIAHRAGWHCDMQHVMFGLMKFAEGVVMSTRKGAVIPLRDLLDEAEKRAFQVLEFVDYPDDEKKEIARVVGLGAVKYQDLSQNPASDIVFQWDKALNLQGNSAPYLHYAYARVRGIYAKHQEKFPEDSLENASIVPQLEIERDLCLYLLQFGSVVHRATQTCKPNLLADWLFGAASRFAAFYNQAPILKEESSAIRHSRLRLAMVFSQCMKQGLYILGMDTLERM
ncbi:MAG: arginine--tRNA ligase [Candidatus Cloacimonetes bacterium]|nr:arginine--tRNA ligase [Candidatus Cloacimonadota bacterium]